MHLSCIEHKPKCYFFIFWGKKSTCFLTLGSCRLLQGKTKQNKTKTKNPQTTTKPPPSWERSFVLGHLHLLSRFTFHVSNTSGFCTVLYSPGLRNSCERAFTPSDAVSNWLLKKVNGLEEKESIKHTAQQPEGGERRSLRRCEWTREDHALLWRCSRILTHRADKEGGLQKGCLLCASQVETLLNPDAISHHHPAERKDASGLSCLCSHRPQKEQL